MIAIQGAYTKVTTALAVPNLYNIDPFDLYGNLLSEMTIEVDSTLAQPAIFLPAIADLNNNWQIKINIIATTGSVFPVFIGVANPPDKIGAAYDVSLASDGANIEINPIGANNWYGVATNESNIQGFNLFSDAPFTYSAVSPKTFQFGNETYSNAKNCMQIFGSVSRLTEFVSNDLEQVDGILYFEGAKILLVPKLKQCLGRLTLSDIESSISFTFPELEFVSQLSLIRCNTMNFPILKNSENIYCSDYQSTTFNFPELEFSNLIEIFNATTITDFQAPKLISSSFFIQYIGITDFQGLPLFEGTINNILNFQYCESLVEFSLTALKYAKSIYLAECYALTIVDLPQIIDIKFSVEMYNVTTLLTFNLGNTLKSVGGNVIIENSILDSSSVDNVLIRLADLDGTNGTTIYSDKTVAILGGASAPSAAGLTAKATLISRGCFVETN